MVQNLSVPKGRSRQTGQQQTVRMRLPVDLWLFASTLTLVVIGLCMVLDASYIKALDSSGTHNDALYYFKRQGLGAVAGIGLLFFFMRLGYWNLRPLAPSAMFTGLALLALVPFAGVKQNGAVRWLSLGGLTFQPSEIAKLLLILFLAAYLSGAKCKTRYLSLRTIVLPLCLSSIYLALIEREPDLGTACVLFMIVVTQFCLAGIRKRHLLLFGLVIGIGVSLFAFGSGMGHRAGRITTFLHPEKDPQGQGYQVVHAQLAVGSGQWIGEGIGRGKEKYFLPQGNSDFIFATYAEETGFVGCVALITLMGIVGWRGFLIAARTEDRFGALLASGIAANISWQALVNIGTATGSIPATGVPLPFISNGVTSLILLLASIGILLNIARHPVRSMQGENGGS